MRDCHRPSWIAQKISDFFLNREFPEGMKAIRRVEKDSLDVASFEQKKQLVDDLVNQFLEGNLRRVHLLAELLSIRSREQLAPQFRKDFREIQIHQRDLVFSKLDRIARSNTELPLPGPMQTEFIQGIQLLGACLDNPDVQNRMIDYLADCRLPMSCRQAIFQSFRGFRYHKIEQSIVMNFQALLRNGKSSWGEVSFLGDVAGSLLQEKIAGSYREAQSPLVKYFSGVIDCLPKYSVMSPRHQRFVSLVCDLITTLPLQPDLHSDEFILGTLGRKLVQNIRKIGQDSEASRELGLRVCNQFLENTIDTPNRTTKTVKLSIEGALRVINNSCK